MICPDCEVETIRGQSYCPKCHKNLIGGGKDAGYEEVYTETDPGTETDPD